MRISDWSSDVCSSDLDFVASSGKEVQPLGPPGMFDNFGTGLGDATMQGLARTGRAASMVLAAPVVMAERNANLARRVRGVPESHDLTDRYFREVTDDLTGGDVAYWTQDGRTHGRNPHTNAHNIFRLLLYK